MSKTTFGDRLASLMKAANLNQTALADRVGIDRSRISRLVNNKRPPNSDEVVWLAQALGVEVEAMLKGIEVPEPVQRDIERAQEMARKVLEAEAARDEALAQLSALRDEFESRETQHQQVLEAVRGEHRNALDAANEKLLDNDRRLRGELDRLKAEIARLQQLNANTALEVRGRNVTIQQLERQVHQLRCQLTDVRRSNGQAALVAGLLGLAGGAALGGSSRNT